MADLNYNDLELKKDNSIKVFKFQGKDIEVKKYLSTEDKYDIVMITLQKSLEEGYYNPIKLDMYFHLNLIYLYTNIVFNAENREDEFKLYDEIKSSGFLDTFLQNIDGDEYKELQEDIDDLIGVTTRARLSAAYLIGKLVDDLPANAEAAQRIVDNFDPDKFQAVKDFAQAANGGRAIS